MLGYYNQSIPNEEEREVFELITWQELCASGMFTPDDGKGYQSDGKNYDRTLDAFGPKAIDCTYIVWFNK